MVYFIQEAEYKADPIIGKTIVLVGAIAFGVLLLWRLVLFIESFWVECIKRQPPFRHVVLWKKTLNKRQLQILKTEFTFYQNLNKKEQAYFEHRVATFVKRHSFTGKSDFIVNDKVRILISATAVMLTFGYRDYNVKSVDHFIIYPEAFYSRTNKAYHKGEFNLGLRSIALSWEDFLLGYDISNDNLNLGIHEYVHAMHFEFANSTNNSVNAVIFMNTYNELRKFLNADAAYKDRLIASKYLRNYAYTNTYEFVAVLIESFMETPNTFETKFPEMYNYVKQMLNFRFMGY